MKKTKITSIIAMIIFILALLLNTSSELLFYISGAAQGWTINYAENILVYTLPDLIGILVLIIGVRLAAGNKLTFIYPAGFAVLALAALVALILHIISMVGYFSYADGFTYAYLVRYVFLFLAYLLLALDGFLLLRNKVMGIIGAVLLFLTATVFLSITSVSNFSGMSSFTAVENIISAVETWAYYAAIQLVAVGALIYAIGRQPRIPRSAPNPPHVYPPYNYQPPYNGGHTSR